MTDGPDIERKEIETSEALETSDPRASDHDPTFERHRAALEAVLAVEGEIDLPRAAMLVAAEEYPDLHVDAEVERLAEIAAGAGDRARGLGNPFARLDAVDEYLFVELGFRGNTDEYDDPRNSYLNEVLSRRVGIPITLSIVFVEAARAAGFDAHGVALPGHYIARVTIDGRTLWVDPFHGGRVVTIEDCRALVSRTTGRPSLFRESHLAPAATRVTFARLLANLKRIHLSREDFDRALSVVERLLVLDPGDPREIRDRGILRSHLGCPGAAVDDLETYLEATPEAPDADSVRGRLAWLRRKLAESN